MPTYEYACTACGHRLEAVQSFADEPLTECPACEGRLRKLFSAVGIVFKGSGFYRNDSRPAEPAGVGSGKEGSAKEATGKEATGKEGTAKEGTAPASSSDGSAGGSVPPASSGPTKAAAAEGKGTTKAPALTAA